MNIKDKIKDFLPKYLSPEDQRDLSRCIRDFPNNINDLMYTSVLKKEQIVFQGDGIKNLPVINFPDTVIRKVNCIITSNTCDIDSSNTRLFSSRLVYTPLIELSKYIQLLESKDVLAERIENHIKAIKKQEVTQIFYLPANNLMSEKIVFLDRLNNCGNELLDRTQLESFRLFTLSNYGFYLFLLKLSISFTRIAEGVNRK